jgi:hypothetical protein
MRLKCHGCPHHKPIGYCRKLKEVMPNGFAMRFYSEKCGEPDKL